MNWYKDTLAQRRAMALELFVRTYGLPIEVKDAAGRWWPFWGIQTQITRWIVIADEEQTWIDDDGKVHHFKDYLQEVISSNVRQRNNEKAPR